MKKDTSVFSAILDNIKSYNIQSLYNSSLFVAIVPVALYFLVGLSIPDLSVPIRYTALILI